MPSPLGTSIPREKVPWFWVVGALGGAAYTANKALETGLTWLWIVAAVFAGIALLIFLLPRMRKPSTETIQIDETGILREQGEIREHIRWADVAEIRIITTDEGPYSEDVFFALGDGKGRGCLVPHDAAVRTKLFEELQSRFPGLDDAKVIEAMGSTTNNNFLIWKREGLQ